MYQKKKVNQVQTLGDNDLSNDPTNGIINLKNLQINQTKEDKVPKLSEVDGVPNLPKVVKINIKDFNNHKYDTPKK